MSTQQDEQEEVFFFWQDKNIKHHTMEKCHCYTSIAPSASVVEKENKLT